MTTKNLIPRASGEGGIGITDVTWGYGYYDTGNFNKGLFVSGHNITQVIAETVTQGGLGGEWTRNGLDIYYNGGNVGIGTTNPDRNLVIDAGANSSPLRLIARPSDENCAIQIRNSANTDTVTQLGGNIDSYFTGGKVGIGTKDPEVIHHISTATQTDNYAVTRLTADSQQFDVGVGGSSAAIAGVRNKFYIYDSTDGSLSATRLVIDGAGNVGIGTTNPGAKLDVRGNVKVVGSIEASGPVYTFSSTSFGIGVQATYSPTAHTEGNVYMVTVTRSQSPTATPTLEIGYVTYNGTGTPSYLQSLNGTDILINFSGTDIQASNTSTIGATIKLTVLRLS